MKKITLLLFGAALLMLFPVKAWSQEAYAWLSSDGKTFTFCYDDQKSSREGTTYGLSDVWNNDTKNVETVEFYSDFANVKPTSTKGWFKDMSKVTEIPTLRYLDTSNVTDMSEMFYNCKALTRLDLSRFNTLAVTNMASMFCNCQGLKSLNLGNFDTEKVTDMSVMFYYCSSLTSLDLSNFKTGAVTNMSRMFQTCRGLESLDVSSFNTAVVTNMNGMFSGCIVLESLDVSKFNTEKVTDLSYLFFDCKKLPSVNVSNFDTKAVENMSSVFGNCESFTSLDVSSFNTSAVTNMSFMFSGCKGLKNLDVSNFDTKKVTDMQCLFRDCSGLTSLDLSDFNTASVTNMNSMFQNCSGLTSIDVSSFNTTAVTNTLSMFEKCTSLTTLDVSNFDVSNNTYAHIMFDKCTSLQTLKISPTMDKLPNNVCGSVGTSENPCQLVAPEGFDFGEGVDPSGEYFEWKSGYFKTDVIVHITISSYGLATFCYPKDLDFSDVTDYKAYVVNGYNSKTGSVTLVRVKDVPAGTGIIVKGTAGTYDVPVGETYSLFGNYLIGTTATTTIQPTEGNKTNLALSVKKGKIGFYTFSSARKVEAYKAYLQLPTSVLSANGMGLEFEDETTGIDGVEAVDMPDVVWYTIDGRRLDAEPTQKGLYIANGRKVVVK